MKKLIKKLFSTLGFKVTRINKEISNIDFDELLAQKINKNPIIFDVGGNQGQSIERFKKIFPTPTIHSFEPIKSEFDIMYKKFGNDENIFLNNFALGDKIEEKEIHVAAQTGSSSFNKITKNTKWLKVRSKQSKITEEEYILQKQKVMINTIDNYCKDKKINRIDLLKIDTQGYEDKVLEGSSDSLKDNNIRVIITEIMFDNVYDKYFSFSDIEKYIIPHNFRMVGIDLANNNLFSGLVFFSDVYYFNKKFYDL